MIMIERLSEALQALLELQDYLKQPCGAINPKDAKPDTSGYGLEIWPEKRKELGHRPQVSDVLEYYTENRTVFDNNPALRIGWDRTELNIGVVTPNGEKAVLVAKYLDQRAIFDITANEELYVGGEGKRTYFPGYPLEQRLLDLGL
jgi:hypothetical protein